MHELLKYLQLAGLIFRHGHVSHSGEDFNKKRIEGLKGLEEFFPTASRAPVPSGGTTPHALIVQAAFIKNSWKTYGGHLTVNNLCYVRIPKAASTSMSYELLKKKFPDLHQQSITERQINFLADIHLEKEVKKSPAYFTIVRNPFSRLVSVYRDLFENPDHYVYRDYLFGILPQQLSFSEFVDRISRIPDRLKDQHIKPQCAFLKFYERQGVNVKVFKLEETGLLNQFLNQHGLLLPHLNKSGESYDDRSYYDHSTWKKASEIYRVDIEQFGYDHAI